MKRRLLTICMALTLCLGLLPAMALAADDETVTYGTIEVGGISLTNSESTPTVYATTDAATGAVTAQPTFTETDGWNIKWDGSTLTLRNATIQQAEEYSEKNNEKIAVYRASGDLNLALVGVNTVDALGGGSAASCGINLGNGSLSISGADGASLAVYGGPTEHGNSCGIYARGTITINSGTVNVTGESASAASYGICASGAVTINGGSVTAASGEAGGNSCGIYTNGPVTVNDGTVTAESGKAGGSSFGIHAYNGTITINGGTVKATSGEAQGDSCGIFAEDSRFNYQNSVTIHGGTVTATAGDAVGTGWYSCGIRSEGPITITGGTVNATGKTSKAGDSYSYGIYAVRSLTISGGTVTATGGPATSGSSGINATTLSIFGDLQVLIKNATVTATGGTATNGKSNGIWADTDSADIQVTIEDSTVTVTGSSANKSYGILTETVNNSPDASLNVTINGNSVVRANMTGEDGEPIGSQTTASHTTTKENSIVFENGVGTVHGTVELKEDLTIKAGESLTIPQDATLNIPEGKTLTNCGTITNEGTLENKGTLTIGQGGALTGNTVTGNPLTYAVTVQPQGSGSASASPAVAEKGDTVTLTASPGSGSHFERWEVVSGGVTIENNAFIMPSQPVTVRAIFDRNSSGPTRYAITTSDAENGTVTVSPSRAARGTTVTITVTPDEGYELERLRVLDSRDGEIALTDEGDGKYTFTMPAGRVTVAASFVERAPEPLPFADVPAGAWFEDAVRYVYENGLMNGTGETAFSPDATTSRAMIVTILWRLEDEPVVNYLMDFTDVDPAAYYAEAVRWAASEGIVTGTSATSFAPGDPITREQLATMLYRYAQTMGYDVSIGEETNILSYTDFADMSEYAIPAMQWACGAGIINGTSESTLTPQGSATRAQLAAMIMRFCENAAQ